LSDAQSKQDIDSKLGQAQMRRSGAICEVSCGGFLGDALCAASIDTEGHHDRVDEFGVPPASIMYRQPEATT
jgi:hypothetical protein